MTDLIQAGEVVEQATVEEARQRAEQIRQGIVSYAESLALVGEAFRRRDWIALGHDSWESYLHAEFGEDRLRAATDVRRQAVEALRTYGMSTRAIATALGVSHMTVHRDLPSGVTNVPPDPTPTAQAAGDKDETPAAAPVTGLDGKSYPPPSGRLRPILRPSVAPKVAAAQAKADEVRDHNEMVRNFNATVDPDVLARAEEIGDRAVAVARIADACEDFVAAVAGVDPERAVREALDTNRNRLHIAVEALAYLQRVVDAMTSPRESK